MRARFERLNSAPPHLQALEAVVGRALAKFAAAETSFAAAVVETQAVPRHLADGAALLEELFASTSFDDVSRPRP